MDQDFSEIYDVLMDDFSYEHYADTVLQLAYARWGENLSQCRLLELGCGTGNLTALLAPKVGEVFAVDASEAMLNKAVQKDLGENITWSCQDIRELQAPPADIVVVALDTLNYLDDADFSFFLQHIRYYFREEGLLCFDLNTKSRLYDMIGSQTWVYEQDGIFYAWESEINPPYVDSWIHFFVEDENGKWTRIEEEQTQCYHEEEKARQLLEEAGFEQVRYVDLETLKQPIGDTQRCFFSAFWKKA